MNSFTQSVLISKTSIQSINKKNKTNKWQETEKVQEGGAPTHSGKGLLMIGSSLYVSGNPFEKT